MLSASGYKKMINSIVSEAGEICGNDISLRPDGYVPLYIKMIDYIARTQIVSFSLTFVIVLMIASATAFTTHFVYTYSIFILVNGV